MNMPGKRALRHFWIPVMVLVFSVVYFYIWLSVSLAFGPDWIIATSVTGVILLWIYGIMAFFPHRSVILRRVFFTGFILTLVLIFVELGIRKPAVDRQSRIEGTTRMNENYLLEALARHDCPEGVLVVVPWVLIKGVDDRGNVQLVELRWIFSDITRRSLILARTTHSGEVSTDAALQEARKAIISCEDPGRLLNAFLQRMAEGHYRAEKRG